MQAAQPLAHRRPGLLQLQGAPCHRVLCLMSLATLESRTGYARSGLHMEIQKKERMTRPDFLLCRRLISSHPPRITQMQTDNIGCNEVAVADSLRLSTLSQRRCAGSREDEKIQKATL